MAIVSSLLCVVLSTACATTGGASKMRVPQGSKYVALGSSYAAGAGIGPLKPGSPERCGRTVNNYASLLASAKGFFLVDASCGGATTAHVLGSWNELPPQIDVVDAATRLVTITVGGNDINFVGNLFMASCKPGEIVKAGPRMVKCVEPSWPKDESYAKLESALEAIVLAVRQRSPRARVIFVQYVTLVGSDTCPAIGMPSDYLTQSRRMGERLAEVTRRAAKATDAEILAIDKMSIHHTPCDPFPWSNGTIKNERSEAAPWHPNAAGHNAIAAALTRMMR